MVTSASFIITEKCNLACKYCFESKDRQCGKDMQPEVIERGIEWLFENAIASNKNSISIILFGGEPLLRPELCAELLEAGYQKQLKTGIKFNANLITNGTHMNTDIEYILLKYAAKLEGFTCQLSVDGNKEAHDLYRVYPSGKGSFDVIDKNFSTYKYIFKNRLSVHGCVNKNTLPLLFNSYKYFADTWGMKHIWFMPVHTEEWDESDVAEYDKQLGLIFDDMVAKKNMSIYAPIDKCLGGLGQHHEKTCGAGTSFLSITGNGDLYPCHNIYFNNPEHDQVCGNVFDGITNNDILKPYHEYTYKSLGCEGCENTKCYRCIADNYVHNGDITKQVGMPHRCAMSSVERKYQIKAREFAEKHFVPENLKDVNFKKQMISEQNKIINNQIEMGQSISLILQKLFKEEVEMSGIKSKGVDGRNSAEG